MAVAYWSHDIDMTDPRHFFKGLYVGVRHALSRSRWSLREKKSVPGGNFNAPSGNWRDGRKMRLAVTLELVDVWGW